MALYTSFGSDDLRSSRLELPDQYLCLNFSLPIPGLPAAPLRSTRMHAQSGCGAPCVHDTRWVETIVIGAGASRSKCQESVGHNMCSYSPGNWPRFLYITQCMRVLDLGRRGSARFDSSSGPLSLGVYPFVAPKYPLPVGSMSALRGMAPSCAVVGNLVMTYSASLHTRFAAMYYAGAFGRSTAAAMQQLQPLRPTLCISLLLLFPGRPLGTASTRFEPSRHALDGNLIRFIGLCQHSSLFIAT